jgi:hypothetical protein
MAKRTSTSRRTEKSANGRGRIAAESSPVNNADSPTGIKTTGRFIVIFKEEVVKETGVVPETLKRVAGIRNESRPRHVRSWGDLWYFALIQNVGAENR